MLKLRFKNNKHNAVWLVEPKVSIGRGSANDLVVDDAAVAETHAEIVVDHEKLALVNLSDGLPLFVNKTAVPTRAPLKTNDVVTLGKIQLQVVDPKNEPKAVPTVVRDEKASGWALKANHSALANRVFTLKRETVIGRSNECDITLAASHLSRRHARLMIRSGQLFVKDLDSSNGTFLNGERVTEARVKRGDELRFDTLSFGVVGPADDLDKTTVRDAGALPPKPKAAPARAAARRQAAVRPPPAAGGRPEAAPGSANAAAKAGLGWLWLLLAGGAGALIWYVAQSLF